MSEVQNMVVKVTSDVSGAKTGLVTVQSELAKTAVAAQKVDSTTGKMGGALAGIAPKANVAAQALSQAGGAVGDFASMGSTLLTGGIILAIPLIISGLEALGKELFGITQQQQAFNDTLDAVAKDAAKAIASVSELTTEIDLAKKGFIDKDDVVKHYNDTIGKTAGIVKTVEEAEASLNSKGNAFIKSMILKSAATFAFARSAELLVQAFALTEQKSGSLSAGMAKLSSKLTDQAKIFKDIGEGATKLRAILSAENGLDFAGNDKLGKEVKIKVPHVKIEPKKVSVEIKELSEGSSEGSFVGQLGSLMQKKVDEANIVIRINPDIKIDDAAIKNASGAIEGALRGAANTISNELGSSILSILTDTISSISTALQNTIEGKGNFFGNFFGALLKSLGEGIKQLGLKTAAAAIAIQLAKKNLGNISGIGAGIALVVLGTIISAAATRLQNASFATGVRNFSGGFATINERGPENVFLPRGASVQPHNQVMAYGGGGSGERLVAVVQGQDLAFILTRAQRTMQSNYGV